MNAPEFLCVPEHVARNPIARAIARSNIAKATAEYSTRLHMLEDGEECASDLDATARVLGVAIAILEARKTTDATLTAGMAALAEMAGEGCRWMPVFTGQIDAALQQANDVFQQATATETRSAWVRVTAA